MGNIINLKNCLYCDVADFSILACLVKVDSIFALINSPVVCECKNW